MGLCLGRWEGQRGQLREKIIIVKGWGGETPGGEGRRELSSLWVLGARAGPAQGGTYVA